MPRIPKLQITLSGGAPAEVALRIDGKAAPSAMIGVDWPVDPGKHRVEVQRGQEVVREDVEAREGAKVQVTLTLRLPPPAPPPPSGPIAGPPAVEKPSGAQRTAGAVMTGLGGAGIVAGAITWGLAYAKRADLDKACPAQTCTNGEPAGLGSYDALRAATFGALIGGGVVAGAGIVTLALAPKGEAKTGAITPFVTPTFAGVRGQF
jgi:hypothetical protein